jgi:hypothetical protein
MANTIRSLDASAWEYGFTRGGQVGKHAWIVTRVVDPIQVSGCWLSDNGTAGARRLDEPDRDVPDSSPSIDTDGSGFPRLLRRPAPSPPYRRLQGNVWVKYSLGPKRDPTSGHRRAPSLLQPGEWPSGSGDDGDGQGGPLRPRLQKQCNGNRNDHAPLLKEGHAEIRRRPVSSAWWHEGPDRGLIPANSRHRFVMLPS